MPALFALTLALGAALLFAVQPLAARSALPILGGTPAVWNTSMVFFQAVVLAGYAAAHLLARRLSPKLQAAAFLMVIALGVIPLPPIPANAPTTTPDQPLLWLLGRLTAQLALPCFALALASPLLQRWYARTTRDLREPYFLYSASNAGSLGALLAYPLLLEPHLDLDRQAQFWTVAYLAWGALIAITSLLQFRQSRLAGFAASETPPPPPTTHATTGSRTPPSARATLAWIGLGAIPASLLQGCTLFLTTDVASVPLLWVVPLALYLTTFIVAFARHGGWAIRAANRSLPFLATALLYVILSRATQPVTLLVVLHLAFLFLAGVVCHGRLVSLRPAPEHLTAFYLALALGGVLGSAFNALLAPQLFQSVAEYPLAIAIACLALPYRTRPDPKPTPTGPSTVRPPTPATLLSRDLAWAAAIAIAMAMLGVVIPWLSGDFTRLRDTIVFGLPAIACCTLLDRPRRLAFATAAAFAVGLWLQGLWTHTEYVERNFFGITRVTRDPVAHSHQIVHGNTIHGRQFQDPDRRREPLTYYHRQGPLGSLFAAFPQPTPPDSPPVNVGVIGLGAGSMAAYARTGERWTFFEIDPAVIRVARDPRWFSFLQDSHAGHLAIVEGDARLQLREQPDASFDLLVLDAFSSDAIPVHLLTREALQLYLAKLRPGGWLIAHVSNRYLALEPVFAALARDAGIVCRSFDDGHENAALGKEASHWICMARTERDLRGLQRQIHWLPAEGADRLAPWTDRRAGVLEVFEWRFD